ncbi:MAG: glycosyl hydrolase family 32 [Gemmatimonadetes bacterium]|nr:glycosyl hydrolase family 32 [Gemmatimonadota bacterium]MBT7858868.1 glycosyl hydrolase family 32 [Gemmatimonadota bacterium]
MGSEVLYNGIRLPKTWPPREVVAPGDDDPMPVPYLAAPPSVIRIDRGRQLFVDDFLIAKSTLTRTWHRAQKWPGNPVMAPQTELERGHGLPAAVPKSGGIWWDPFTGHYRMWYDAGWSHKYAHATSRDGLHWERRGPAGASTNHILPGLVTNSSTAFIDPYDGDAARRYKMFVRQPDQDEESLPGGWAATGGRRRAYVLSSADGLHWSDPVPTTPVGDRSTIFYNPFRRKWVHSIRSYHFGTPFRRIRNYRECDDLMGEPIWNQEQERFWIRADREDAPDPELQVAPQLYNLDAVGYESLMLGIFEIHLGPDNDVCAQGGFPKTIDLKLGFSRDGFHWHRPDRRGFIASTRQEGDWDRGYVQSVGGCCLVRGDELLFYYTGFRGDPTRTSEKETWDCGMYSHASTGLATLRRDGFASLDATATMGTVITRPVTFGGSYIFVNADCSDGEMRVEVLDEAGKVLDGFGAEACYPIRTDTCKYRVAWRETADLADLCGQPVRFRFQIRNGSLYSFWVSAKETGESGGFLAAGSPESGLVDD